MVAFIHGRGGGGSSPPALVALPTYGYNSSDKWRLALPDAQTRLIRSDTLMLRSSCLTGEAAVFTVRDLKGRIIE